MSETYSLATLGITPMAFKEIYDKLWHAGYRDQLKPDGTIDMTGLALKAAPCDHTKRVVCPDCHALVSLSEQP